MSNFSIFKTFNGKDYEFSHSFLTSSEADIYSKKMTSKGLETHIVKCSHKLSSGKKYFLYDVYYKIKKIKKC